MEENQNLVENEELLEISDKLDKTLTLESSSTRQSDDDEEEEEDENGDENEEFEFCFLGGGLKSPVSAEEVFEDGQIRVISPFSSEYTGDGETSSSSSSYGRPVKNVFVVSNSPENDDVAEEGSYCVWKAPSPEMSQKSNSTGFSKLRKMRDLLHRSNSDGKDAFVFLNGKSDASGSAEAKRKEKEKKKKKKELKIEVGEKKGETTSLGKEGKKKKKEKSAYEALYLGGGKDKRKGGGKSYLPYRQDLVGFFTNGSALSRNVHPY
ncbi:uncharacterized protein LOC110694165 [Chenopodium quinoa]|uniref:uncharacterized protein LOC110694165 n=1 Tax=Chenopodium quinoa TaxID=63459 RepID=UPI000B77AC0E|nr:uncharacterized protein LOC110694165 [Chenopodium quinoa]